MPASYFAETVADKKLPLMSRIPNGLPIMDYAQRASVKKACVGILGAHKIFFRKTCLNVDSRRA